MPLRTVFDTLRYSLMRAIAFGQAGDCTAKELVSRYKDELGNLLNRILPPRVRLGGAVVPTKESSVSATRPARRPNRH